MKKKCPFCAEDIQAEAIVCRFCGRDLPQAPVVAQDNGQAPKMQDPVPATPPTKNDILLGWGCFGIVILAVFMLVLPARWCSDKPTELSAGEREAKTLVQNYGQKGSTILDVLGVVVATSKATSNYGIKVKGWTSYSVGESKYYVTFYLEEGGKSMAYEWEANLNSKTVHARNANASAVMDIVKAYK